MPFTARVLSGATASDFNRVAGLYDELQAPLSDSITSMLIRLARIGPLQKVLDIGTGTGSAALRAARAVHGGFVTGIDVSEGMLAIARRKAAETGLNNLRFTEMDASSLEFEAESFDAVVSNLGIPTYLFREAISESFRVLRDGGVLCFAEFSRASPAWSSLSKVLAKFSVEKANPSLSRRRRIRRQISEMASQFPLESFTRTLKSTGFAHVRTFRHGFTMIQPPSDLYLRYLVTREHLEYSAMPEESKRHFNEEMLRRLEAIRIRSAGRLERQVVLWKADKPARHVL